MSTPHPYAHILVGIAEGKAIQHKADPERRWVDVDFNAETVLLWIRHRQYRPDELRVKPEPKIAWYRVAERHVPGNRDIRYAFLVNMPEHAKNVEALPNFTRWLTDWVEYEVTE